MKKILSLIILSWLGLASFAQTAASYDFTAFSGTFSDISSTGTTVSIICDDCTVTSIPIGFTFQYCGTNYTETAACSNGFLSLANSTGASFYVGASYEDCVGLLMPFWADLYGSYGGGATSHAYYETLGTAPNREFVFQWDHFDAYDGTGVCATCHATFEVILYETSNVIDFVYSGSTYSGMGYSGIAIGIANSTTDYQTLEDDGTSPTRSSSTFYYSEGALTGRYETSPDSAQVYRWAYQCSGTPDAGTICPTADTGCGASYTTTLNLCSASIGGGLSYIWQYSSDSSTWTTISGATNAIYTATVTADIYYRCMLTCSYSGLSDTTAGRKFYIFPYPDFISGPTTVCAGQTMTLTDDTVGGSWISHSTTIATVGSSTGLVTGIGVGTDIITYRMGTSCLRITTVTVSNAPTTIIGARRVCTGVTTTESDGVVGGYWSSNSTAIGTVGSSTGIVTGISVGSTIITYGLGAGSCYVTDTMQVNQTPPAILGTNVVCVGSNTDLSDGTSGGIWVSIGLTFATIGSSSGIATGVTAGTSLISYTIPGTGCTATETLSVNPIPLPIAGTTPVCVGNILTLSDATTGATWISSNTTVATVGTTGAVLGLSAGTSIISYELPSGCMRTTTVTVNPNPAAIFGTLNTCQGFYSTLADDSIGGTWTGLDLTVVSVGSTTGVVTGVLSGTTTITYAFSSTGCYATAQYTVNPTPDPIAGVTTFCLGTTTDLSDADAGGIWTCTPTSTASVGSLSGVVTGNAVGLANVTYTLPTGCYNTTPVSIYPNPDTITGPSLVCVSASITLTDATGGGGTWGSGTTSVATITSSGGLLVGGSAGTTIITYMLSTGCFSTTTITVTPSPSPITGTFSVCTGQQTDLNDVVTGGSWTSSLTTVGSVGSTTGIVGGISGGTATVTYSLGGTCRVTHVVTVYASPAAIGGTETVCAGSTTTLTDGSGGGTWSSSSLTVGTVGTTGIVGGVSAGTVTISYRAADGCAALATVTVNATPTGITGTLDVCLGMTNTLTDGTTGGTWSSGNSSVGTIGSTGEVTGVATGSTIITYAIGNCRATAVVTVTPNPAVIMGSMGICAGATTDLTDGTGGGTWSSGTITVGTVGSSTGVVTGIVTGTTTITYKLSTGCLAIATVTVNNAPGAISGSGSVCATDSILLSDATGGGTWASANTAIATAGSLSGEVDGVGAGTVLITYSLGSGCVVTKNVTVNAMPGHPTGASAVCVGATTGLGDGVTGGTWTSGTTAVGSITGTTGIFTGIGLGTTIVTYTAPGGCTVTDTMAVSSTPLPISGTNPVCNGSTVNWTDAVSGGLWTISSAYSGVASVGSTTGLVTGVSMGSAIVTYSLGSGCTVYRTATVIASPAAITGAGSICVGAMTGLTESTGGGVWISGTTSVGTVSSVGIVGGIGMGTTIISYELPSGCLSTDTISVNPTPTAITGTGTMCAGSGVSLTDGVSGGVWTSSNTLVATVGTGGAVSGVSAGSAVISYGLGGACYAMKTVTVYAAPTVIGGGTTVCMGATLDLTDGIGGGTWISGTTAVGSIGFTTGILRGDALGTTIVTYTLPGGCNTIDTITVSATPLPLTGVALCVGASATIIDGIPGGTWASANTAVATISTTGGTLNGIAAGTAEITYSLGTGCTATTFVTVNSTPAAITGTASVCMGMTTVLADATGSGTWSSSATGIATVTGGSTYGVSAGTATITYMAGDGCYALRTVTVNSLPGSITGNLNICQGATSLLGDVTTGGTWSSSNALMASVTLTGGIETGVSMGSANITYTLSTGCYTVSETTVNPMPGAITGGLSICAGNTTSLGDGTGGGTWSSSNTAAGTIVSGTGVATGIATGTTEITYMLPAGCYVTAVLAVKSSPGAISGSTNMCVATTTTFTDTAAGGTWASSNAGIASVTLTGGVITGAATGSAIITYALSDGCAAEKEIIVNPTATAISGPLHLCAGSCYALTDAVGGGTWSSTSTSTATINVTTGEVCGVTTGTSIITYLIGAGCLASATVTVASPPDTIAGAGSLCQGSTATVSDTGSGTWSWSPTGVVSVSTGGVVSGVGAGTAMITFTIADGCTATAEEIVDPVAAIGGPSEVCQYGSITLTNAVTGGTWTSGSTAIATIDGTSGTVTGVNSGSAIITYTLGTGCTSYRGVTVTPSPAAITGTDNVCIGQTTALGDGTGGGTWSSTTTSVATVNATGVVSGISAGTTTISYKLSTGCSADVIIAVNGLPTTISGLGSVCVGSNATAGDGTAGGSWSSSNTTVAGIGSSTGSITGAMAGTTIITYTLGSGCIATGVEVVNPVPDAITGAANVCVGLTTGLTETTGGGTWSSGSTAVATVAGTGVVSGIMAGTAMISYTLSTGCYAAMEVNVLADPSVISGGATLCVGGTGYYTDSTLGGTWATGDTGIAVIDPVTGALTGRSSGTVLVSYTVGSGCMEISTVIINPVSPVDGPDMVCAGQSVTVSDTTEGGTWSTGSSLATVIYTGDTTASVTGVSGGAVIISYTLPSGCVAMKTMSVNPGPGIIYGTPVACVGQAAYLGIGATGGTWSVSNIAVGTITTGGTVTGMGAGTATVSYTLGGCPATVMLTVNPNPAAIVGSPNVCVGSSTILADATAGGTWSSTGTAAALEGTTSAVLGLASGTATVSYILATGCYTDETIVVNTPPGSIVGNPNVCVGGTETLHDTPTGGTWASGAPTVGYIDLVTGNLTGINAGTTVITYTSGAGCNATMTVNVLPATGGITGNLNACLGMTDTLGDATGGGGWSSSNPAVGSITTGGVVTGLSIGTTIITYSLTTGAGCMATAAVTVNPNPDAISGTAQLCAGTLTTLYDFTGGGTWSSRASIIALVDPVSGVVTGGMAGTAIIAYRLNTGCAALKTVTVYPQPTAIGGDKTVCLGSTSTLTDSVGGGAWYSISTAVATVVTAGGGTEGIVTGVSLGTSVIIYSIGPGCSRSATVNVVPLPNVYTVTGGGNYCSDSDGVAVGLSGSDGGTNYLLYQGSTATGAYSGSGLELAFGLQTVGGTYTVIAINTTTGCTNHMSGSAAVTPIPTVTPAVGITASGGDTVCAGTSVTYTANATNGGTTPAYQWSVNGVNVATAATYTYVPATSDIIRVVLTSDVRCPAPDTASHAIAAGVLARQNPYVNFSANPGDTLCQGMAVTLTAAAGYGGADPVLEWMVNSTVAGSGNTYSYIPANGDTIWCFMTSSYPCLYNDTVSSPRVILQVDTPLIPVVTITANPGSTIGIGRNATLTANVSNGGLNPTYQWYINGVPVANATSQTFTSGFDSTFEDTVSVLVTSSGICPMTVHAWIYIAESDEAVTNVSGAAAITVLPNPSNGTMTIKGSLGTTADGDVEITVTDVLGQQVYDENVTTTAGRIDHRITLGNNTANGMYLLTLHTGTGNLVFHVVVSQ